MPKSKIDATIKNLAKGASTERSSSSASAQRNELPGDPNCPHCGGVGYLRLDVPVGHPDFGRLEICVCRRANVTNAVRERLFALSHLDELKELTFESFKPRGRKGLGEMQSNSLEMAYNHARPWKPKSWPRRARFLMIRTRAKQQHKGPVQLDLFEPYISYPRL